MAWPVVTRAQQSAVPVIGFVGSDLLDHTQTVCSRSAWAWKRPALLKARMWRSNIAGQRAGTIGCPL